MGRIGISELIIILVVILLLFGTKRLPEIGRSLGEAIKEFRKAGKELGDENKEVTKEDSERKA